MPANALLWRSGPGREIHLRTRGEGRRLAAMSPPRQPPKMQSVHSVFNPLRVMVPPRRAASAAAFPPSGRISRGFAPFSDGAGAAVRFAASGPLAPSFRLLAHPNERVTPRRSTLRPQAGLVHRKPAPLTCLTRRSSPQLGQLSGT